MERLLLLLPLAAICGLSYGYFLIGRWRVDLFLDNVSILLGILWKVLLQVFGMLGGVILFAVVGFYPVCPEEVLLGFLTGFICAVLARNLYVRRVSVSARRAGLIGEEDLR